MKAAGEMLHSSKSLIVPARRIRRSKGELCGLGSYCTSYCTGSFIEYIVSSMFVDMPRVGLGYSGSYFSAYLPASFQLVASLGTVFPLRFPFNPMSGRHFQMTEKS